MNNELSAGRNPDNPKQYHLFYCCLTADDNGETRHPQIVMNELTDKLGFKILECQPQSLFDGWSFWIETENDIDWPLLFRDGIQWRAIGKP